MKTRHPDSDTQAHALPKSGTMAEIKQRLREWEARHFTPEQRAQAHTRAIGGSGDNMAFHRRIDREEEE